MRTALNILTECALDLVSEVVSTTLSAPVVPGVQTVAVGSVAAIYVGALLVIDNGSASQEQVVVTAVGAGTITANFASAHAAGASVQAPTFSEGRPDGQLFTQAEMLAYCAAAQNELLLAVRPVYASADVNLSGGQPFAPAPADAIRVERVTVGTAQYGVDALWNVSEPELDMASANWGADQGAPQMWYQDGTRKAGSVSQPNLGFTPTPQADYQFTAYYSQRGADALDLLSELLVPDVAAQYVKYGVLGRCWGKDGEQRDPRREAYSRKRFEFGCLLLANFVSLVGQQGAKGSVIPTYSPLQIAPERGINALASR